MGNETYSTEPRVIRVFVSSTFRDMQAERDELVKFIFPQLRKLCESRGVTWGEVDLRWGITDEQTAEGKVLPICLEEIQRCRPYFIGLLGERYGWIPDEIPEELIQRQPWLAERFDHSITELEILHGVLNNPGMAEHAFFYFRDPAYIDTLPPQQRSRFQEEPATEEIAQFGIEEANRRSETRKGKLTALKERILESGYLVRSGYPNPKQLGEWVLRDLIRLIDDLYPEGSQPDPLDREAIEHEAFAASRARVYIGRKAYFDRLDEHAQGNSPPLTILGDSGSGKSALLANWAIRYRTSHPQDLVLMHFIGATPTSADWEAMLRRILGEFKRHFNLPEEIPDQPDELRKDFLNWLYRAAAKRRVLIILDALNQLEDRDGAPDLVWLPSHIPENVRILLSTLPGRPLDELNERGWPTLAVEPLDVDERKQLIREYLALFTKSLSPARIETIANAPQCQNPLFLHALLDELRLFGVHEQLDERIEAYLKAPTIPALYELILERCEQDYERDHPALVRDSMSLLWAARRGLSEAELLELLGSDGQPLPRAHWSPFFLALEQSFVIRAGLIGFFHDYLRQAVQNRYLPTEEEMRTSHFNLAAYFEKQPRLSPRQTDELPWQLAQSQEWQRLYDLLSDLEFFVAAWKINRFDVMRFWAQVEANSAYRMAEAFQSIISQPNRNPDLAAEIGSLLTDSSHYKEALSLWDALVHFHQENRDAENLAIAIGRKGSILFRTSDWDGAIALHREEERICHELGDTLGLQRSLGNQANVLLRRKDLDGAMLLYQKQEQICRQYDYLDGLERSLNNQGLGLLHRGDTEGAMTLFKEQERICRQEGFLDDLQRSLGNQGIVLYSRGDADGAMVLFQEQERICRDLRLLDGLAGSLIGQAKFLTDHDDQDRAFALIEEAENIYRQLGDLHGLQQAILQRAPKLHDRGELGTVMRLYKEAEGICQQLGYKRELSFIHFAKGLIYIDWQSVMEALDSLGKALELAREVGDEAHIKRTEEMLKWVREHIA
jgi:hypothetical protein